MQAIIEQIQREFSGMTVNAYPITLTEAVYDASGHTLEEIISSLARQDTLLEVKGKIEDVIDEIMNPEHGLSAIKAAIDGIEKTEGIPEEDINDLFD